MESCLLFGKQGRSAIPTQVHGGCPPRPRPPQPSGVVLGDQSALRPRGPFGLLPGCAEGGLDPLNPLADGLPQEQAGNAASPFGLQAETRPPNPTNTDPGEAAAANGMAVPGGAKRLTRSSPPGPRSSGGGAHHLGQIAERNRLAGVSDPAPGDGGARWQA